MARPIRLRSPQNMSHDFGEVSRDLTHWGFVSRRRILQTTKLSCILAKIVQYGLTRVVSGYYDDVDYSDPWFDAVEKTVQTLESADKEILALHYIIDGHKRVKLRKSGLTRGEYHDKLIAAQNNYAEKANVSHETITGDIYKSVYYARFTTVR